jgi:hypothetical protein
MALTLQRGGAFQFRSAPGAAFDLHARDYPRLGQGAAQVSLGDDLATAFLQRVFNERVPSWQAFVRKVQEDLAAVGAHGRDDYLAGLVARTHPADALATLIEDRFGGETTRVLLAGGALTDMPPLTHLEVRAPGGLWQTVAEAQGGIDPAYLRAFADVMTRLVGYDPTPLFRGPTEPLAEILLNALMRERVIANGEGGRRLPINPGVYLLGHTSVLIRGRSTGLLIDPVMLSPLASMLPGAIDRRQLSGLVSAVAMTRAHPDFAHLPSILCYADRSIFAPPDVEGPAYVESLAQRLTMFGVRAVPAEPGVWRRVSNDLAFHSINVGHETVVYAVDVAGARVLVLGGAMEGSVTLLVEALTRFVERQGPIQCVVAPMTTAAAYVTPDACLGPYRLLQADSVDALRAAIALDDDAGLTPDSLGRVLAAAGASVCLAQSPMNFSAGGPVADPTLYRRILDAQWRTKLETPVRFPPLAVGEGIGFGPGGSLSADRLERLEA